MGLGIPYDNWKKKEYKKLPPVILACGPQDVFKEDFVKSLDEDFPAENRETVVIFADDTTPADLLRELQSGGLFSSSKLLVLKRLEHKAGSKTQLQRYLAVLEQYLQDPNPNNVLILEDVDHPYKRGRKVGTVARMVEKAGGWAIVFWEPFPNALREELRSRVEKAKLHIDPAALQLLLEKTQGKLARARMEVDKLIQFCDQRIDMADVKRMTGSETATDTYQQLKDSLFAGDLSRVMQALAELERTGQPPVAVFYVLFDYLHTLRSLRQLLSGGKRLSDALKELGIPASGGIVKKYNKALSQVKDNFPRDFYRKCYELSRRVKYSRAPFTNQSLQIFLIENLPKLQTY